MTPLQPPSLVSRYPYDEHWQGWEVKQDAAVRVLWIWHGSNIRVICVPHDEAWGYAFAWCYPRDPSLVEASLENWDMAIQDEPSGWHKRPTPQIRRAPRRGERPYDNRDRCRHGCRVVDGCRTINCPDTGGRRAPQPGSEGVTAP